ncbi:MAG: serine hydrolase, partial [Jiangellaceae bacterium]|nr:serine hydrolase [Jiangellaceae bacterium]
MRSMKLIAEWPAENAAAAVVPRSAEVVTHGDADRVFPL